ncbi:MerR family transcriptional regulator [Bifidobacterium actinocoloniiforme DSM 22766]|uniref:MerR family transcriptional regulator n=1 Tax=Bifidobacterium actinocoloniiforme DSM 22766 TaxID=1437605 RepID=A0A086Z0D5_9BIFI|nr:MerR family transcriptional regulator [Bifidobacterium actinocoloniiforme]AKV55229.1 transcriptional regulator [Bifidobacterium actinocoloniiforme DSM 22766]KFI39985.1 MerR family transcriptional regulator [Bifidobacterium actinocoloniiforme DSM 22766]
MSVKRGTSAPNGTGQERVQAIQGELFAATGDEPVTRGYRGSVASEVAGITYRQLDYWARKGIMEPSITQSHGSGSRRLYSFKDIVILAVLKHLLDIGVVLPNATVAVGFLSRKSTQSLEDVTIVCDGESVEDCQSSEQLFEIMTSGKAVFAMAVGSIWRQVRDDLVDKDYVDLDEDSVFQGKLRRPLEEMAIERLRQRIELQQAERREYAPLRLA